MSGPPLAGRPPFATDEPDSYYSSPSSSSSTPQQRTRFHIPSPHEERVNANKRTSAYDVYDNYLAAPSSSSSGPSSSSSSNPFASPTSSSSNNTSSNRDSGIGALLMSLDDSDSDSDSEESPAPRSKNAALAAAVSSNSNSSNGTGPTPNAHRLNPFTNPQGQGNPFETPPLQVQSRGPAGQPQMQQQQQTQRTVLAAPQPGYAAPIAALNLGQLTASAGSMPVPPQAAMTRQPQPPMPGMSMAVPAPVSMPHPHPHQHAPKGPPSTLQINTSIPLPMPAHSPFTPITPFTPGGAPFDPSRVASPHPLLPPVTPIVPAFVKPIASSVKGGKKGGAAPTPKPVGFDESVFGGGKQGGVGGGVETMEKERRSVETLDDEQGYPIPAPRRRGSGDGAGHGNAPGGAGGKGDEFWRRFSMVVREGIGRARRVHGSTKRKRSPTRSDIHARSHSSRSSPVDREGILQTRLSIIKAQIQVLNNDFNVMDIQVTLIKARIKSKDWFEIVHPRSCTSIASYEITSQRRRCVDFERIHFNLQLTTTSSTYYRNPKSNGVMIRHSIMMNGPRTNYNMGRTLVHEVGRWSELFHTFEGGCDEGVGDNVADTLP
ncbi:hypothetical protein CPC08DRAFT_770000 [Agrocybe pediades]|nr:hypothetical protein CPC08DRAFT_770000 [Agrocybe pediades]